MTVTLSSKNRFIFFNYEFELARRGYEQLTFYKKHDTYDLLLQLSACFLRYTLELKLVRVNFHELD